MKFSAGFWRMREGVHAVHPVEVLDCTATPGSLVIDAPAHRIGHRGDLLRGPVVTITCTSPMPDVIGVKIAHFTGEVPRRPEFELGQSSFEPEISVTGEAAVLTSGELSLRIDRGEQWRVDFLAGGRTLTTSSRKAMAIIETDGGLDDRQDGGHHGGHHGGRDGGHGGAHYVREQLDLGVDHFVYGLGERFGPLVKNGQAVDIWNADGGTASELAYKNVPFFLTNAGYGVFVNHPGHVSFEVASEAASRVQFSVAGQSMEYFLIYGPTPKEILRKYTALTGRPARLPAWSYGLWLSTSFTTDYDEATVTGFIEGMAERDIPLSVFHFDCFWMREFNWCDFEWDPRTFPDPPGMLKRLKEKGLRVCVWINPYIAQRSPLFAEGKAHGYLLKRPNGDVWQWDLWQPGMGLVDFTNPEARRWYAAKLDALLDMGVDCFKTDFGERIPTDVAYFDGSDPERMHNYYTSLYNETVFELLRERRGEAEAILFARSATAGTQRFPVHWGGDCESTFEGMGEDLRGGLSLGMSGFGYWSHDIGGFEGTPDAAVFKRWIPFGLLSSHSRLHGNESYRVPWAFDEEAVAVLRSFTRLKMRLMPYLARAARQAHTEGLPMMRAMVLEFPGDPACTHLERQYMLGDDLLVAPVFSAGGEVSYYVPAGTWTHYLTGRRVTGPRWVRETHGFDSVPLLVRPGAVIPEGAVDDRSDYDYADGVTLRVYEPGARVTTEIPGPDGEIAKVFTISREDGVIRVVGEDGHGEYGVLLVGVRSVGAVEGGTATGHEQGVLIQATGNTVLIEEAP